MNVDAAYAACRAITRREARNFAWGIMLLPPPKRAALSALYAFARRVDDVADGGDPPAERRRQLGELRALLHGLPRSAGDDPVLVALADTLARYPVPREALGELIDGALWDVDRARYETWPELREYCRRVAGTIGLACTAVYGPTDPERARPLAETLGLALQQINIMRDVPEDLRLGRVYLPQDELARFAVTEEEIAAGRTGPGWRGLMAHQGARAHGLLAEGLGLVALLDRRSALCVRTLAGIYAGVLGEIERRQYDVFSSRPRLSAAGKLRVIGSGLAQGARRR
ncbi:MAG: phytoene/squalene synthase family protein [Thermoleophilia bacterium]|nr:phytoene/squalene synthase family protein [Thermoleophilia bacterium]